MSVAVHPRCASQPSQPREAEPPRRSDTRGPLHHDDLFSVTSITAGSAIPAGAIYPGSPAYAQGAVVEQYDYGDFGTPNPAYGQYYQSPIGNRFMFTGREWDPEVQMYHYRTRYMLPDWGRFASRDRIGVWGSVLNFGNGQTLVANDPQFWLDPFGLDTYSLDRGLNPDGAKSRNPEEGLFTHTFIYTTNPDGSLKHTYSWGNRYGKDLDGDGVPDGKPYTDPANWYKDAPEDTSAAKQDIARRRHWESLSPEEREKIEKLEKGHYSRTSRERKHDTGSQTRPVGRKIGGPDLDPFIDDAFEERSNDPCHSSRHPFRLTNNCKDESRRLHEEAQRERDAAKNDPCSKGQ